MEIEDKALHSLFPEALSVAALGELNAWTSVQSIGAAARMLEQRSSPCDQPAQILLMPFDDLLNFEWIFIQLISWFIEGYRVPSAKVSLALALEPQIQDKTATTIENLRFRPTIRSASPGVVQGVPKDQRVFVIQDDAPTIEVVQAPLRCLMDILTIAYKGAYSGHQLRREAKEKTGGAPTIFHRHYADSRLFATVEALSFSALGMEIGPHWGVSGTSNIVNDYRAINVQTVPPVNAQFLDFASKTMENTLDRLR
jgi:hypothetical protein